jgi:hypothetical protein
MAIPLIEDLLCNLFLCMIRPYPNIGQRVLDSYKIDTKLKMPANTG